MTKATLAVILAAALPGCSDPGQEMARAAAAGDLAVVRRLAARHPGSVNAVVQMNDIGWRSRPLIVAVNNRRYAVVSYLISKGARFDLPDSWVGTPLQAAISNDDPKMTGLLLRAGAPPDARDADGQTALHWVANTGDKAMVKLLLAHGADPALADKSGKTPADYALKNGELEIAKLLKSVRCFGCTQPKP